MTNQQRVLDKIELNDGRVIYGIVDYVTTKQIYFFDLTREEYSDYVLLAILWQGNKPNLRFSVYVATEYPFVAIPSAVLIPKKNIKECTAAVRNTKKAKQRRTKI